MDEWNVDVHLPMYLKGEISSRDSQVTRYTFLKDYRWLIVGHGFLSDYVGILRNKEFIALASGYIPRAFEWRIFLVGELCLVTGIFLHAAGLRPWKSYFRSESAA